MSEATWTPEKVKEMLDSWGRFTDLSPSEYQRIADEHNATLVDWRADALREIQDLADKAAAMRDIPNEHERRLYAAIDRTKQVANKSPNPENTAHPDAKEEKV